MRSQQQIQFVRRRSGRCVAISAQEEQFQQKALRIVAFALATGIIAMWVAYLPAMAGSVLDTLGIVPQHLTSNAVNRLHKGDQLARVAGPEFATRWSAATSVGKPADLANGRTRLAAAE